MTLSDMLVRMVEDRFGVRLSDPARLAVVESLVRERTEALGLPSPEAYLDGLSRAPSSGDEIACVVDAITNGQTFFFRDRPQFDAAAEVLLRRYRDGASPLRIWSAGCSTGEEPYSLAILCQELGLPVRIVGTDLHAERLRRAREAVYDPWALRYVPADWVPRHFELVGERFRVRPHVRSLVSLRPANLCSSRPLGDDQEGSSFDLILCQNVFIYMRREVMGQVVGRLAERLHPQGALLLGASESLHGLDVPVQPTEVSDRIVYAHGRWRGERDREDPPVESPPPVRPDQAAEDLDLDVGSAPVPIGQDLFGSAVELLRRGRDAEAQELLRRVWKVASAPMETGLTLGHIALRRHDLDTALSRYEEASRREPLHAEPRFFAGLARLKRGEAEGAMRDLRSALFQEPDFWPASLLLAGVLERLGEPELARRELRQTLAAIARGAWGGFRSHVEGIPAATLSTGAAAALCRRRLRISSRPSPRPS